MFHYHGFTIGELRLCCFSRRVTAVQFLSSAVVLAAIWSFFFLCRQKTIKKKVAELDFYSVLSQVMQKISRRKLKTSWEKRARRLKIKDKNKKSDKNKREKKGQEGE